MVSDKKVDGWIDDLVGAICDPIIVMPGGWGDTLPDWMKTSVHLERLVENMLATKEDRAVTATDAEAACYLYTASLTHPIGGDMTQVYLYVAGEAMKAEAKGGELPEEIRVDALTDEQWRQLKLLKDWIYRQRADERKRRRSGERREAKGVAVAKALETKAATQPKFF